MRGPSDGSRIVPAIAFLRRPAELIVGDFIAQYHANLAWAFATAVRPDEPISVILVSDYFCHQNALGGKISLQDSYTFVLSLFNGRCLRGPSDGSRVVPSIAYLRRPADLIVGDFIAQYLANIACSFADLGQLGTPLLVALARAAGQKAREFNAQDVASTT